MKERQQQEAFKRFMFLHPKLKKKDAINQFRYFMTPHVRLKNGRTAKQQFIYDSKKFVPLRHSKLERRMIRKGKLT